MTESRRNSLCLVLAIAGTFLIVAALVFVMRQYTQPPPLGQTRIVERKKFLAEVQAANAEGLNNYAWQDPAKGLLRLPITNAMELTIREYHNAAAARSDLTARANKAFEPPPPPPKQPEKANPIE